jgi:hypothetical protein
MNKKYMYATSAALLVLVFAGGSESASAAVNPYAACVTQDSQCKLGCSRLHKVPVLGITRAQKAKKEQVKQDHQECRDRCVETAKACHTAASTPSSNTAGGVPTKVPTNKPDIGGDTDDDN